MMAGEEEEQERKRKLRMSLVRKESSTENPSFRWYYSVKSGAVPFHWEIQPGTPKHPNSTVNNSSLLPPLTPPPSYLLHRFTNDAENRKKIITTRSTATTHSKFCPIFRTWILPNFNILKSRRDHASKSVSSSSTATTNSSRSCSLGSLLSSSPSVSSSASSKPSVNARRSWKKRSRLSWGSSSSSMHFSGHHDNDAEDDDDDDDDHPKSMTCFGMRNINVLFFTKCRLVSSSSATATATASGHGLAAA